MTQYRKLIAYLAAVAAILAAALASGATGLTERGLDTTSYAVVGALLAFCGGNAAEHFSRRNKPE